MPSVMGQLFLAYSRLRLRRIARWMSEPAAEQRRLLVRLARRAAGTQFGCDHELGSVRSVEDFQARVPLRQFHDLKPYWDRLRAGERDVLWPGKIRLFAVTSGSTGEPKYVPVSDEGLKGFLRAGRDILSHYIVNTGDADHFLGKFLYLGGARELAPGPHGTINGDLSGIVNEETPWAYRPYRLPTPRVHLITDWEAKLEAVADEAWNADVRGVSGIPSWLVALFERVLERRRAAGLPAGVITEAWPNLALLVHGGVSFEPYRDLFRQLIGRSVYDLEVYLGSEGFLAIQDQPESRDLLLRMDAGIFHEFVPVESLGAARPPRFWAGNVETGVDYAIAVTTASGLWGSFIGDTVRFVSLRPHRVRFAGRTEQFLSAFGEHLRAVDVEAAVVAASARTGARIAEFTVAPIYPSADSLRRGHQWFVEFDRVPGDLAAFVRALDEALQHRNVDYEEHRRNDADLPLPEVQAVPAGTFYEAMKRLGRIGGQFKVPHLENSRRFAQVVEAVLVGDLRPASGNPGGDHS
ncbi:MAG: GH3 auxin-responsive promoter family protein [Polyangiaceae bacterium]|nr:GH3 auxin-responsive promoter family protein [Polyangiaceae bacterium]